MKGWTVWLPLGIFLALAALFVAGLLKPDDRIIASKMIGKPLPEFALPAAATDRPGLARAELATGEPHLLNIFASWCVPCAAESANLARLAQGGADIVGVAIRDARPDVDGFLARNGNPYSRIGLDARSSLQIALGSSGVPETFVVDGKGIIRYQHVGEIHDADIPMLLEQLEKAR